VCTNLNTAKSIGIPNRDVYMFPCPTCSASAASQMQQLTSYLSANCASAFSGRVWLDIEGSQYWYSSTSTNKDWYEALVDSCKTYGVDCGVYSSSSQWSSIFGSSSYSYGSSKLLSTHIMIFNLDLLFFIDFCRQPLVVCTLRQQTFFLGLFVIRWLEDALC
jgi:hypothetical protein